MISGWSLGAALYLPHSFPEDAISSPSGMTLISQAVCFRLDEDDRFLASSKDVRRKGIPRNISCWKLRGTLWYRVGCQGPASGQLGRSIWPCERFNDLSISQSEAESIECSITTGRVLENGKVKILSIFGTGHGLGAETLM